MAEVGGENGAGSFPPGGLKAREDVVSRQVDDEWVLYDPVSEKMHVLNLTAGFVWKRLDGNHTLDDLVEKMREAFESSAPTAVVSDDVSTLIAELDAEDLLT